MYSARPVKNESRPPEQRCERPWLLHVNLSFHLGFPLGFLPGWLAPERGFATTAAALKQREETAETIHSMSMGRTGTRLTDWLAPENAPGW